MDTPDPPIAARRRCQRFSAPTAELEHHRQHRLSGQNSSRSFAKRCVPFRMFHLVGGDELDKVLIGIGRPQMHPVFGWEMASPESPPSRSGVVLALRWLRRFGQMVEHVGRLVHPATLLPGIAWSMPSKNPALCHRWPALAPSSDLGSVNCSAAPTRTACSPDTRPQRQSAFPGKI